MKTIYPIAAKIVFVIVTAYLFLTRDGGNVKTYFCDATNILGKLCGGYELLVLIMALISTWLVTTMLSGGGK